MLSFVFLVIGFALMIWGADKFVAGASALARKLGVSPLLIGLTIVAFGTSMPELAVSVTAALRGANEIAVGNVVGSNIFNLLVVAGLSAAPDPHRTAEPRAACCRSCGSRGRGSGSTHVRCDDLGEYPARPGVHRDRRSAGRKRRDRHCAYVRSE